MKSCTGGVDTIHSYLCGELQRCQSEAAIPDSRLARRPDVCCLSWASEPPLTPHLHFFNHAGTCVCVCVMICDTRKPSCNCFISLIIFPSVSNASVLYSEVPVQMEALTFSNLLDGRCFSHLSSSHLNVWTQLKSCRKESKLCCDFQ